MRDERTHVKVKTLCVILLSVAALLCGCSGAGRPPSAELRRVLVGAVKSTAQSGEYVDSIRVGNVYGGHMKRSGGRFNYCGNRCEVKFTLHGGGYSRRFVAAFGWYMKDASDLRIVEVNED